MHFHEVHDVVMDIVHSREGRFITSYQICNEIKREHPLLWNRLVAEYPSSPGQPAMGEHAGTPFSPASFVAHALRHFKQQDPASLISGKFDSTDVVFEGIEPGFRGGWLSIWAWPGLIEG